ncbi:hypothetical protein PG994_013725 [Apiospora phragmitis]|uniref:Uncharacterized protein n=1 Tax=Apiospora phragmitis TaxID=2905665 RepID=A0ABR1T9H2_9PEZI
MATNAPVQSPDQQQGEGKLSHRTEPETRAPPSSRFERRGWLKKVRSKKKRFVFRTAGLRGSIEKPGILRCKDSMRDLKYRRTVKRNIGYLMMPKTPKSDEDRDIEEQEQEPTQATSDDEVNGCPNGRGVSSHDPLYKLGANFSSSVAQKVAAHAGRKEVREEDFEVLRKVYFCFDRIQGKLESMTKGL